MAVAWGEAEQQIIPPPQTPWSNATSSVTDATFNHDGATKPGVPHPQEAYVHMYHETPAQDMATRMLQHCVHQVELTEPAAEGYQHPGLLASLDVAAPSAQAWSDSSPQPPAYQEALPSTQYVSPPVELVTPNAIYSSPSYPVDHGTEGLWAEQQQNSVLHTPAQQPQPSLPPAAFRSCVPASTALSSSGEVDVSSSSCTFLEYQGQQADISSSDGNALVPSALPRHQVLQLHLTRFEWTKPDRNENAEGVRTSAYGMDVQRGNCSVTFVHGGSPAEAAGVRAGMHILAVNGVSVCSGDQVPEILRDGVEATICVDDTESAQACTPLPPPPSPPAQGYAAASKSGPPSHRPHVGEVVVCAKEIGVACCDAVRCGQLGVVTGAGDAPGALAEVLFHGGDGGAAPAMIDVAPGEVEATGYSVTAVSDAAGAAARARDAAVVSLRALRSRKQGLEDERALVEAVRGQQRVAVADGARAVERQRHAVGKTRTGVEQLRSEASACRDALSAAQDVLKELQQLRAAQLGLLRSDAFHHVSALCAGAA